MKQSILAVFMTIFCACTVDNDAVVTHADDGSIRPDIIATNAFYYYRDVEAAWNFYADVLGFETVVDYGFAKILRVADSSYLTVVRASDGMHSVDEPKTVTLTLVTDELDRWTDHLRSQSVRILTDVSSENHVVAVDPEGYYLRFSRYNPHPNHASFVAAFAQSKPVVSSASVDGGSLSVRAAAYSAYFVDADAVRPFYEDLFAVNPAGQVDGVQAYQLSSSGFLLLVDNSDGLHTATDSAGVTFSFFTNDVDGWYRRSTASRGFELRTPEIIEEGDGLVRVFVGYDPVGTFLEWDTFQAAPENVALLGYLQ